MVVIGGNLGYLRLQGVLHDSDLVSAEIYDANKKEIIHEVSERAAIVPQALWQQAEDFQIPVDPAFVRFHNQDRMTAIATVPIKDQSGNINGYIKGLCIIRDETLQEMKEDILGSIAISIISTLATLIVLFPIIIALQRQDVVQARRILDGNLELLEVLGNTIAYRDSDTDSHNYRVTLYAIGLAEHIHLEKELIRTIIIGSFLHDIGKIGITDAILLKPGKLTDEEFDIMKTHVSIGVEILKRSVWVSQAMAIVLCHHEKFNGTGYPNGTQGALIPTEARLFAIVDVFDALTTRRPYKEPRSLGDSMDIMRRDSGRHFDPDIFVHFEEIAARLHHEIGAASYEQLREQLSSKVHQYMNLDMNC